MAVIPEVISADSAGVTRARRNFALLAILLPLAGAALIALAITTLIVPVPGLGRSFEFAAPVLIVIGPALLVLGLHMVVWRSRVRALARMSQGKRDETIIRMAAALSWVSVLLVAVLVYGSITVLFTDF